jgi:hypothetical protein
MSRRTVDDLPARAILAISAAAGEVMEELVQAHEERMHLPPRRTDPVTAVPFAGERLPDTVTCEGIELLRKGHSLDEAADFLSVEAMVLERAIYDYRPPYRRWLVARGIG